MMSYPIDSPITDEKRFHYFNRFISEKYGDYAYLDRESMEKERDGQWVVMGGVTRPYMIYEADSEYPHIRYDVVPEAFSLELSTDNDEVQLRGIARTVLKGIVEDQIKTRTSKYEAIVLDTVKGKLAKIHVIQTSHTPIIQIIDNLDAIFNGDIDLNRREYSKWNRYFPLLEDLEIISKIERDQFSMGNAYKDFERKIDNKNQRRSEKELIEEIFGYVIQYGSPFLNKYLGLTASKPYINLTNTFYYFASKIGKSFKTSVGNLQNYYNEIYRSNKSPHIFRHWVNQLEDVGIFTSDSNNIVKGDPEIFESINSQFSSHYTTS